MKTFAFISYSRKDRDVASWLQVKLEKYPYPREWVNKELQPNHDKFIRKVFLDTKDLPVTDGQFDESIKRNLKDARYLIVLCSENSTGSVYVNNEIKYFLETHDNNPDLVLPVFINKVENNVPEALLDYQITDRNCPIYNRELTPKSESNTYCFYHIVSFLLKVDHRRLYDRYQRHRRKKGIRRSIFMNVLIGLLSLLIIFLIKSIQNKNRAIQSQNEVIELQKELIEFEKNIFPLSIVFGYTSNFLMPVVNYIKDNDIQKEIYILMPYCEADLQHQDRIKRVGTKMTKELGIDSIYVENLPTSMRRGSRIGCLASQDDRYRYAYVDFASTTSTFAQIINYKKEKYPKLSNDEMIKDYSDTFIRQCKEQLEGDSSYVYFYTDPDLFVQTLKNKAAEYVAVEGAVSKE